MEPLSRLTILSLEQATVLPYLTFRLAQDGLRVIRLEHPITGDPNRFIGQNVLAEERMNSYYLCINAGKEALTLNLAEPEGQELLGRLIVELKVDIFCTNQLPKNYAKLGIDYDRLKGCREDLIWLGVTGFGPQRNEAAYDPILQARGGLMEMTGEADSSPQVLGVPLPDMGTSEHAYGQIMKALYLRALTGRGRRIDLAMLESTASWLTVPLTLSQTFGRKMTRRGNIHEFFAPVSVYPTADGYVYLAMGNDKQWASLIGLPGFEGLDEEAYRRNEGRIKDVANLNRRLTEVTRTFKTRDLLELWAGAGLAAAKIASIDEVAQDPYVAPNLLWAKDPRSGLKLTLAPPPLMTEHLRTRGRELSFPPRFGEHNQAVYGRELGLSPAELDDYRKRGVI